MSLFKSKLSESGLTVSEAKSLGMRELSPKMLASLIPKAPKANALHIPYFDASGKERTNIFRVRLLGESAYGVPWSPKYLQASGTPPAAYFSKNTPWKKILSNPDIRICITEGELKAACACKLHIPTIGLGGIWSWGSKKLGWELLPELEAIAWTLRSVIIVVDSDGATNPLVEVGAHRLAAVLRKRGAKPRVLILPSKENGDKNGLDDYLVALGRPAFEEYLKNAKSDPLTEALWEMNERYAYVTAPDVLYDEKLHTMLNPHRAFTTTLANRSVMAPKGDGTSKLVAVAKPWFGWPHRREYARFTYAPGEPIDVGGNYNLWPGWGVEEKEGDLKPWFDLLDFVLGALTREERTWFERWLAYPIQHPGAKLDSAVCVWSRGQRIGKSFIALIMGDVYGTIKDRENFAEIHQQEFESAFTSWGKHHQFVLVDDVNTVTRTSAKDHAARLKTLITQESFKLNIKHIANYTIPDTINYFLTSNRPDALLLDEKDCRFFVVQAPDEPQTKAWYARINKWRFEDGGPAALLYHLRRMPLGDFTDRTHPPKTGAKEDMHRLAQADHQTWAEELYAEPNSVLTFDKAKIKRDLYRASELLSIFSKENETCRVAVNTFGASLSSAGFNTRVVRVGGAPIRLIPVRNREMWEKRPATEWAKHYAQHCEEWK